MLAVAKKKKKKIPAVLSPVVENKIVKFCSLTR